VKLRTHAVLMAALASIPGWSQDFSLYSTTIAQMWKQDAPGFDKSTFTPATQFLGIDVNGIGKENLSLHLFGWGRTDLGDASLPDGKKTSGELTYGFVQYRFQQANAEIKAGRFTVNQGVAIEQVDGVSARADLKGGFTISAFGGRPVLYKTRDAVTQKDYDFQRDFIFGTRLGLRFPKFGEIGLSYLQDGTQAAKDLPIPSDVDYTREQVGFDIHLVPHPAFDFSGRTVFDVADRADLPGVGKPSKIAEHDYTLTVKAATAVSITGNFTERNFQAFFAGTNLPSLFRTVEKDKHRAYGASVNVNPGGPLEFVADYRHTTRESFGDSNRFGGDVRWTLEKQKIVSGFGYHRVTASDAKLVDAAFPSYSLTHSELRAWVMAEKGKLSASLDGIYHRYDDDKNPHLNGRTSIFEVVGSLGMQTTSNLRISGDLSYAANPLFKREVRGLLRAEYRFTSAKKGGGK